MKRLLMLATLLFFFINIQAQDNNKLLGTWEIKSFQYSNNSDNNEKNTPFRKYKSYTPTNFLVTEINNQTNITTTSIFGTYEVKDGIYTEKILSVNRESAGMIGRTFSFTLTFEDNDKMYSTGSFNGMKTTELWYRIENSADIERSMRNNGPELGLDGQVKEKSPPLFVLKNGDKYINLKFGNEQEMPLRMIEQNAIENIEVVKGQTALSLFGDSGKYGVVIISLKEGKLEPILEILKSKGMLVAD